MRKVDAHIFQGMLRDASISKQKPEFLWEANNIRLTPREGDTMLSMTNERGPKKIELIGLLTDNTMLGSYVGHCVIDNYLVVFTHGEKGDYIFRVKKNEDGTYTLKSLTGIKTEDDDTIIPRPLALNFDTSHPFLTIGVYENEYVLKVYWTDGVNQPRVINITKDLLITSFSNIENTYTKDSFDFVPKMTLNDSIYIQRVSDSSALFGAGVIQYAVSYYNKYGLQSNISCVSPLIPTSFFNRAGSAEEKIGNAFKITIKNPDTSFEYLRLYSIFRSSIDTTPIAKRVIDVLLGYGTGDNSYIKLTNLQLENSIRLTDIDNINVYEDYSTSQESNILKSYAGNTDICKDAVQVPWTTLVDDFYVFKKEDYPYLVLQANILTNGSGRIELLYITWGTATELYISRNIEMEDLDGTKYTTYMIFGVDSNNSTAEFARGDSIASVIGTSGNVLITDNNTIGEDIDATELMYVGGESITAGTICLKDGTLFLGDINVNRLQVTQNIKDNLPLCIDTLKSAYRLVYYPNNFSSDTYKWGNSLNAKVLNGENLSNYNIPTAGFKYQETYRLGLLFLHESGKWSEPIFISDEVQINYPRIGHFSLTTNNDSMYFNQDIPIFKGTLIEGKYKILELLKGAGYVRVRTMIALPNASDRHIIALGILAPTVVNNSFSRNHAPDVLSSWFFRPWLTDTNINWNTAKNNGNRFTHALQGADLEYKHKYFLYHDVKEEDLNMGSEIQGVTEIEAEKFSEENNEYDNNDNTLFYVNLEVQTMHSPDLGLDSSINNIDTSALKCRLVGIVPLDRSIGDIDIQTSTPGIGEGSTGFFHQSMSSNVGAKTLCSGWFYRDDLVDDMDLAGTSFLPWKDESNGLVLYQKAFRVYPWHRSGSLNNDISRPDNGGTRSAMLQRKVISNLKFSDECNWYKKWKDLALKDTNISIDMFNSDEVTLIKLAGYNYYGNIDLLIAPDNYGIIVDNGDSELLLKKAKLSFDDAGYFIGVNNIKNDDYSINGNSGYWPKGVCMDGTKEIIYWDGDGLKTLTTKLDYIVTNIGNYYKALRESRDPVRMKYKSTPHGVIALKKALTPPDDIDRPTLYLAEIYREPATTDYSGSGEEALKLNLWIPTSDPVRLDSDEVNLSWDYGDTWYQRWDCLKTYSFTNDDLNSVIEIASFMVESHTNIDGRYDRNRGLTSNLSISPTNFNLINPVYSLLDNFFNYRIQDDDYYSLNSFPSMITWSTLKNNASDIDPWTIVTLASTLEMDGVNGAVTDIVTHADLIYAFLDKGLARINFNVRVLIPTSDGVPVEISNSYKVDGYNYISTAIGSTNKFSVLDTAVGIYFIDHIGNVLYLMSGELSDVSDKYGFNYWFSKQDTSSLWKAGSWLPLLTVIDSTVLNDNSISLESSQYPIIVLDSWNNIKGIALYYDFNKKDLYINTSDTCLCYSDYMTNFVSFMSYQGGVLFNIGSTFNALSNYRNKQVDLWEMFTGEYNEFFYKHYPTDFTFISNVESQIDKIFTNIETRVDFYNDGVLQHKTFFDSVRVWNEYQDTGTEELTFKYYPYKDTISINSNAKKKFRIWKCDIPRALKTVPNGHGGLTTKKSLDRIRNTWCKLKFTMNTSANLNMEMHDMNVIYYS